MLLTKPLGHRAAKSAPFHLIGHPRNPKTGLVARTMKGSDAGRALRNMQRLIGRLGPAVTRELQLMNRGLETELATSTIAELERRLRPEPLDVDLPGRREQMRMEVARIAARELARRMNGRIDRKAVPIGKLLGESVHQSHPLGRV